MSLQSVFCMGESLVMQRFYAFWAFHHPNIIFLFLHFSTHKQIPRHQKNKMKATLINYMTRMPSFYNFTHALELVLSIFFIIFHVASNEMKLSGPL